MGALDMYINMLGNNAGALSAISSLQTLDASVKKNDASIKGLEKSYAEAASKAQSLPKGAGMKGWSEAIGNVKAAEEKLAAARSKQSLAIAKQDLYRKGLDKQVEGTRRANAATQTQQSVFARLSDALSQNKDKLSSLAGSAQSAGGPIGSLVGQAKNLASVLSKGGVAGAVVAVAVGLVALAAGAVLATVALAAYAIKASDAARSSALLSSAAAGSGSAGWELETVVDQLSNKIPQARDKTAQWARELTLAGIAGRDMQRTLTTMGTVASAVGDSGAAKIRGIAEASRMAQRLMLGARDRFGEFASLAGTGIKSADVYAAVAQSMRTSIPEAKRMVDAGIVPMKKGLEALERAAETKFGPIVARQMAALDIQAAKFKENIGKLFSGVNIEKFLEGLKTVTDLFDTNTVMGYALREVFTEIFTKVADLASKVFPYVRAAVLGVAFGIIVTATAAKRLYRSFQETFGGVSSDIDGISLAFKLGAGLVGVFVGSIVALSLAFVALGVIAAMALAPIWLPFAFAALMIYLMVSAITAVVDEAKSLGKELEQIDLGKAAENIMNSLINGIKAKIADVKAALASVGAAMVGAFDSVMKINSPSLVMTERANYIVDPLVSVPETRASEVQAAIGGLGNLPAPARASGGSSQVRGDGITFTNCTFSASPEEYRRIIREERDLFFMGVSRGSAVPA
jgi:hypothetical protein